MKLLDAVLDLLFPPKCVICQRVLDHPHDGVCPRCLQNLPDDDVKPRKIPLSEATIASVSYEGDVRDSFLRYKFHGLACYAPCYGEWFARTVNDRFRGQFDIITYVPVSFLRKLTRGYDQTELLCRQTAKQLGVRSVRTLRKVRNTRPQSLQKDASARKANVSGAFRAVHSERFRGKRVLLIDDLITTGATMQECCRMLLSAGAGQVLCAALATPKTDHGKKDEQS